MKEKVYVKPETKVVYTGIAPLMIEYVSSDPVVYPGGGASGEIDVVPLEPDPDDTEIWR